MTASRERAALSPDASALFEKARGLYFRRHYEDALSAAQELLEYANAAARAYSIRGLCLTEMGMAMEGVAAAEAAVAADPEDAVAYTTRAFCRHRLGDNAGAEEDYNSALTLDPENYKVYYNYACYWAERGDEERCRKYLARAVGLIAPGTALYIAEDADLARYANRDWLRELILEVKAKGRLA